MNNSRTNGNGTVLVVEDNQDDALLLKEAAQQSCPEIAFHFVQDGHQALAYLRGEGQYGNRKTHPFPKVLVLDLRLPGMHGLDVLGRLRQLTECDGLKVLAWSDGSDPGIAERSQKAGADYFLDKPTSFGELLKRAERICSAARDGETEGEA